uniref:Uncharacterized protein n=1 Tax=viral metagenome TaxID=1070528 RepID=A0A6M3M9G0_9ZZZZ
MKIDKKCEVTIVCTINQLNLIEGGLRMSKRHVGSPETEKKLDEMLKAFDPGDQCEN